MNSISKKKTACFYAIATDLGGAEKSLLELVKGLNEDAGDWKPVVLIPKPEGLLVDELRRCRIDYRVVQLPHSFMKLSRSRPVYSSFRLLQSFPGMMAYLLQACREIRKLQPALIHTTGVKCHILGVVFARLLGIPLIWHLRDIFEPGPTLSLLRLLLRFNPAIEVVCNSKSTAVPFAAATSQLHVIYNGLNPAEYRPEPNGRYHKHFGVDQDTAMVGMVGAFASWKGQTQFLQAARILKDRGVKARFVIVGGEIYDTGGESGLMKKYQDLAKTLGLTSWAYFTGFDREAPRVMNGLQILVHASVLPEPFGRVIIEAMACGTSVVASKWGAAPEFFRDQKDGLLVDPRVPEEIADAVQWLIEHKEEREQMIHQSREVFLSRFTHQRYVDDLKKLFNFAAKSSASLS